ncbi:exodeoxyribonuclease VII small subunit [Lactobacillus gasseri]|uniref:Exodeoxyribonuclease 7 small subunit n=1 Tax=Lactobacillus gasseri TaxID=1596 RepID=A0ABY3BCF0_LACGS|nr:exodeoxyribonuclease VII small subunit [Lactobacillus gasseri]TQW14803.1 Exodeoxyribonuclease 7 small subunit [Lactobacillus gasseri]
MATKKNNFEEQLNELQEIVNKLEIGNVPLEDALNEFQAGVKLSRELEKKLNDAEQTVAKLVDKDGNEKTLDPQNASAPEEE